MSKLNSDSQVPAKALKPHRSWLTEGVLDAEYKEYVLLAWLQKVKQDLKGTKLYPALADVIDKHRELTAIKKGSSKARKAGPVIGLDFATHATAQSSR